MSPNGERSVGAGGHQGRQLLPCALELLLAIPKRRAAGAANLEQLKLANALPDLLEEAFHLALVSAPIVRHHAASGSTRGDSSSTCTAGPDSIRAAERRLPASEMPAST